MTGAVERSVEEIIQNNSMFQKEGTGPKRLLVMAGLPLSGKSYFVQHVTRKRKDRFFIITSHLTRPIVAKHLGHKRPKYDKNEHLATFEAAGQLVKKALELNWPVIADATNLKETYRAWAIDAGRSANAEILVVFMEVTEEAARKRLHSRTSDSSATFEVFQALKYEVEPYHKCSTPFIVINSETDITPHASNVAKWLAGEKEAVPGMRHKK